MANNADFEKLLLQLPAFCKTFFIGIAQSTTELTRINYARDIIIFFRFLKEETEEFAGMEPKDFTVAMLDKVTPGMIEQFLFYVTDYESKTAHGQSVDRYMMVRQKQ